MPRKPGKRLCTHCKAMPCRPGFLACQVCMVERRQPARPTKAQPGSAGKVAVMRRRADRGEQLFHPRDAKWVAPRPVTTE